MICTKPDDYTSEYEMWNTVWHVFLNDGTEVWDDDGRPDYNDPSWLRLKKYCKKNNLYIQKMYLRFRSHYEHLEPNKNGYFFTRKLLAHIGSANIQYFITGYLEEDGIHSTEWRVPELIPETTKVRNFKTDTKFLIKKHG